MPAPNAARGLLDEASMKRSFVLAAALAGLVGACSAGTPSGGEGDQASGDVTDTPLDCKGAGPLAFPAGYQDLCAGPTPLLERVALRQSFDYVSVRKVGAPPTIVAERGRACATAKDVAACQLRVAGAVPSGGAFIVTTNGDDVRVVPSAALIVQDGANLETEVFAVRNTSPCTDPNVMLGAKWRGQPGGDLEYFVYDRSANLGTLYWGRRYGERDLATSSLRYRGQKGTCDLWLDTQ